MGSLVKGLFGGSSSKSKSSGQQSSVGGFSALPQDIQDKYRELIAPVQGVVENFSDYFKPVSLGVEELKAQSMLNPANIKSSIQQYLNPFQAQITADINKQFQAPQSALTARASEAGAFGGSRLRSGQADLERTRLDALAGASANQYNNAYDMLQGGISNLLGFGGLQRDLDLKRRQALPSAITFGSDILSRLLNANQSQGTNTAMSKGSSYSGIPLTGS
jgi:hypothetical protein